MYFDSIGMTFHDLRSHCVEGSEGSVINFFVFIGDLFAETEIDNFAKPIRSHDVFKFHISMNDIFLVELLYREKNTKTPRHTCLIIEMASSSSKQ